MRARLSVPASIALMLASTMLLLAACTSGSVQEARRGQTRDAALTPQLPAQQATRMAQRYFPPTPTPTPAPPLPPAVETLVMTLGVGGGDTPAGSYASLPTDAGSAYAAALLNDVHAGQVVTAIWTDAFGNQVATAAVEFAADTGQQWVALPLQLNGSLSPGEYAVYLFVGEQRIGSLAFALTNPGSGAQLLPDLPTNPQVQPEAPAGQPARDDEDPERRRDRDDEEDG